LAAKPSELLTEGGEPFLTQLLKGISVEVRLNLWKKLADLILKLIENGDLDSSLLPILGGIAPAFLLRINGNVDITIDDYMKQKITENPLVEPILMDAPTLINSTSGKSFENEAELFDFIENQIPPPFNDVASIFSRHLGDNVEYILAGPYGGVKGRISGEGLREILRNGLKYYSS